MHTDLYTFQSAFFFAVYQQSLNMQFEHMETENLTAYALNQSQYVSTLLAGLAGAYERGRTGTEYFFRQSGRKMGFRLPGKSL